MKLELVLGGAAVAGIATSAALWLGATRAEDFSVALGATEAVRGAPIAEAAAETSEASNTSQSAPLEEGGSYAAPRPSLDLAVREPDPAGPQTSASAKSSAPSIHGGRRPPGSKEMERDAEGALILYWSDLAGFDYELPDLDFGSDEEVSSGQIPEEILALDGEKISIEGHMVPVDVDDGRVHSFILSRYFSGCCFGMAPRLNEWIQVDMVDEEGADYVPYVTVIVQGTLEVGEELDEYGYVSSVYRLRGTEVEEP